MKMRVDDTVFFTAYKLRKLLSDCEIDSIHDGNFYRCGEKVYSYDKKVYDYYDGVNVMLYELFERLLRYPDLRFAFEVKFSGDDKVYGTSLESKKLFYPEEVFEFLSGKDVKSFEEIVFTSYHKGDYDRCEFCFKLYPDRVEKRRMTNHIDKKDDGNNYDDYGSYYDSYFDNYPYE